MYKYRGHERLAPLLAEMLIPAWIRMTQEADIGHGGGQNRWDAIAYVPISAQRAEERGFNQAEQMAMHLSSRLGIPFFNLLTRIRHTEKMSFKSRHERVRASATLFAINESRFRELESSVGKRQLRIVLVDDIYTTGSTAEACSAVLAGQARLPVQVYVLTWARS